MNYDEKAAKVGAVLRSIRQNAEGGYDDDRSYLGTIAAFGRECAAEAYEDAASNRCDDCKHEEFPVKRDGTYYHGAFRCVAAYLHIKAAALRRPS